MARSGARLRLHRDARGRLQRVVDPQGRELALRYTARGRIREIAQGSRKIRCEHDPAGHLIAVVSIILRTFDWAVLTQ